MSLYQLTEELTALLNMADTEMSEDIDAAMKEHTALLIEAFDAKADNYAALIRTCETRASARYEESQRLNKLAQADEALAMRLRMALLEAMQATGRKKVQTERFALTVAQNGGKQPVVVTDEDALPAEFRVPVWSEKIDRDAIREALERGDTVEGAVLQPRGFRLNLK